MSKRQPNQTGNQQFPLEGYPCNILISAFFGTKLELPKTITKDILAGIHYAFSTLEDEEQQILRLRYAEKMSVAEAAAYLSLQEEKVRQIESKAFAKLRLPARWNYIRHGVAGYMRKRIAEEHRKGYQSGFCDGYQNGAADARSGIPEVNDAEDVLNWPIEKMGLSASAFNCLRYAKLQRLGDVVDLSSDQIRAMQNLGSKRANEIATAIQKCGIYHTAWDKYLL